MPNRKFFFATVIGIFAFGSWVIYDRSANEDPTFGVGILITGLVLSILGLFIIYGGNRRDAFFGFQACPACHAESIDVRIKLKAGADEHNSFSYCPVCNQKLKLHWSNLLVGLVFGFLPFGAFMVFDSLLPLFVTLWISMPIGLWVQYQYVPLKSV